MGCPPRAATRHRRGQPPPGPTFTDSSDSSIPIGLCSRRACPLGFCFIATVEGSRRTDRCHRIHCLTRLDRGWTVIGRGHRRSAIRPSADDHGSSPDHDDGPAPAHLHDHRSAGDHNHDHRSADDDNGGIHDNHRCGAMIT